MKGSFVRCRLQTTLARSYTKDVLTRMLWQNCHEKSSPFLGFLSAFIESKFLTVKEPKMSRFPLVGSVDGCKPFVSTCLGPTSNTRLFPMHRSCRQVPMDEFMSV